MRLYRICQAKHRLSAFSGLGAERFGGRWNSKGIPLIYTACNLATAQLEMLVHLNRPSLFSQYHYFAFDLPDEQLIRLDNGLYPQHWHASPPNRECKAIGDQFFRQGLALGLLVRSSVSPTDYNCLLNSTLLAESGFISPHGNGFTFDSRLTLR